LHWAAREASTAKAANAQESPTTAIKREDILSWINPARTKKPGGENVVPEEEEEKVVKLI
jgi:hypothetical protein